MNPPLSHPHVLPTGKKRPAIALIIPNTLTALGLAGLLTRMVPHAEIALFHDFREAEAETERGKAFFHYFTTAPVLLNHAAFFLRHQQKTIVLVHGDDVRHLPQGFHTLNVLQSEKELVRAFLRVTLRQWHNVADDFMIAKLHAFHHLPVAYVQTRNYPFCQHSIASVTSRSE